LLAPLAASALRVAAGYCALTLRDPERAASEFADARLLKDPLPGPVGRLALADHVEALVRIGDRNQARTVLAALAARVHVRGDVVGLGLLSRGRGMLADDFPPHFRLALALHERAGTALELGRTQLLYGMRLRRARFRDEARTQLSAARATFRRLGAGGWVEQAECELAALGLTPQGRGRQEDQLTARPAAGPPARRSPPCRLAARDPARQRAGHDRQRAHPRWRMDSAAADHLVGGAGGD